MSLSGKMWLTLLVTNFLFLTLNGSTGHEEVLIIKTCSQLLNHVNIKKIVLDNLNNVSVDCVLSSSTEVFQAIASLDNGEACGLDYIFSANLKYRGSRISVLLSLCFNAFIIHGYLPSSMIYAILVPVVKNKGADIQTAIIIVR